jgi:hypothetical protein
MKKTVIILLIVTGIILIGMIYPSHEILFVKFSYLDLAMGAFSGGNWSQERIGLMSLFIASALTFIFSLGWLLRRAIR